MTVLLAASFGTIVLSIFFVLVCILLIFMVVITPSQEGGMAAAFGGMGSETFFGTRAHQHINKFTLFLAVSFLVLAIWINRLHSGGGGVDEAPQGPTPEEQRIRDEAPAPPVPPSTP